jgi:periplasmic protein TonB
MMPVFDPSRDTGRYVQSWALSIVLHGTAVALSVAFIAGLEPVPEREAFRLQVALVSTPAAPAALEPQAADVPEPPRAIEPPKPSPTPAVRPKAVARPVAPIARAAPMDVAPARPSEQMPAPATPPVAEHRPVAPQPEQAPFPTFEAIPPTAPAPATAAPPVHATARPDPAASAPPPAPAAMPPAPTAAPPPAESAEAVHEPHAHAGRVTDTPPLTTAMAPPQTRIDLSWLPGLLLTRLQKLAYPPEARLNGWEGRVVVRLTIHEDGRISDVSVQKSSGHEVLDEAAVKTVRELSRLLLPEPLPGPKTVNLPMIYHLD